jgi:hypothetical protein
MKELKIENRYNRNSLKVVTQKFRMGQEDVEGNLTVKVENMSKQGRKQL